MQTQTPTDTDQAIWTEEEIESFEGIDPSDGVALEYLELRSTDLGSYDPDLPSVLLVAGHVGTTRLIDNIVLDPTAPARAATQISTKEFA